ncbi:hypothetical protein ABZ490_35580 [Streptomyces sp. NPDC005811]|uniref:hypothetical protein n=1 Tax=Streptomyces sp. NPDC005811 TaxID=3154565 RepID=UPI0033CE654B
MGEPVTGPACRAALLIAGAALALCSCGIPSTGVVEAGGPASGITATTPLYFVQDGALFAVRRAVPEAGDAAVAIEEMLEGPDVVERSRGVTTWVARASGPESVLPTEAATQDLDDLIEAAESAARATPSASATAKEPVRAEAEGHRVSVFLPDDVAMETSALAERQLICTAGRALRVSRRDGRTVTVTVTTADGRHAEGTDEDCPDPQDSRDP